jgi:hypothetical protein
MTDPNDLFAYRWNLAAEFDYKDYARVENADAEEILKDADSFIKRIHEFLKL